MNKKMTTPEVAALMGRWRALAARCLKSGGVGGGATLSSRLRHALLVLFIALTLTSVPAPDPRPP